MTPPEPQPLKDDELDQFLNALPTQEPSPLLMARVAEIPARNPRAVPARARLASLWGPLLGLTACLALGVIAGGIVSPNHAAALQQQQVETDELNEDWEELVGLAFASDLLENNSEFLKP